MSTYQSFPFLPLLFLLPVLSHDVLPTSSHSAVLSSIQHPLRPQLKDVTHVSWSKKYQFLASCHGYNHVLIWDRHGNRVTNKPVVIIR